MSEDDDGLTLPPYPMKIAPPDRREGDPDTQFIRVETCMFRVKLPRYSTYESMRDKLLYAITCALDPLSGQFFFMYRVQFMYLVYTVSRAEDKYVLVKKLNKCVIILTIAEI